MLASHPKYLHELVANRKYHRVLSGAGMSASAGIPTFRGVNGLWVAPRELIACLLICGAVLVLLHIGLIIMSLWWVLVIGWGSLCVLIILCVSFRTRFAQCIRGAHGALLRGNIWRTRWRPLVWMMYVLSLYRHIAAAHPTFGHIYFAQLARREGKDVYFVTQNVDCLEEMAGVLKERVIQLHGAVDHLQCLNPNTPTEDSTYSMNGIVSHRCKGLTNLRGPDGRLRSLWHPWKVACQKCGSRRYMRPACLLFGDNDWVKTPQQEKGYATLSKVMTGKDSMPVYRQLTLDTAMPPEECIYWIIGRSGIVRGPETSLNEHSKSVVIEINPDPNPKFNRLGNHHEYYHIQERQEVIFKRLLNGELVTI